MLFAIIISLGVDISDIIFLNANTIQHKCLGINDDEYEDGEN